MTLSMLIVLAVLAAAVVLFVTEWVRVDLVALLVLLTLALAGIIDGEEAVAGFSNEAVITIAGVLVLSGGLMRTGVARLVGDQVLRYAGKSETRLLVLMMSTVGLLSGIMNDIGVTALMLPVVIDIARRIDRPPSKLLMPLAFGSLLGGMTTLIGTTPNILVAGAMRDHGLESFGMFDFTPVGLTALAAGIAYMALVGRRLLPEGDASREAPGQTAEDLESVYKLETVLSALTLPAESALAGRTLADSRLGSAAGLNVLAIHRDGDQILAPGPEAVLAAGDRLLVEGRFERMNALRGWRQLQIETDRAPSDALGSAALGLAEVVLAASSGLHGETLRETDFRGRFGASVLAIARGGEVYRSGLGAMRLKMGDVLLVTGQPDELCGREDFTSCREQTLEEVTAKYALDRRLMIVRVPQESLLAGKTLAETRLGDAFGLTVLGIARDGQTVAAPRAEDLLEAGDTLLLHGSPGDLEVLGALQQLEIGDGPESVERLESEDVGLAEVTLAPRTTQAGQTLRQLRFRERYGLNVVAVWRRGRAYRTNLRDMQLLFGDAFLVHGERERLQALAQDPDFLVVTEKGREVFKVEKAPVAAAIMGGVLTTVAAGWLPTYIAAPLGAALMVLTGCLSMEDAYRSIEWKAVMLIAGMLSLGLAMSESGVADLVAKSVLGSVAEAGPMAMIAALFGITALSAQIMPTAAVAVLMSPIALSVAGDHGMSPHALMLVVAIASSCAFLSPVGHPVNLLVMGLGGYRFTDYTRVGAPLVVIVFLVTLLIVPWLWPL